MSSILLEQIFPDYASYQTKSFNKIKALIPDAEWFSDSGLMKGETLYTVLMLNFGNRQVRYDSEEQFLRYFNLALVDLLPDIYYKQQAFITNEIGSALSNSKGRAIVLQDSNAGTKTTDSENKTGDSVTPTDLIISTPNDLKNLNITGAQLSGMYLKDSYSNTNDGYRINFINDLKRALNSDYSIRITEFMNQLNQHFKFIQTSPRLAASGPSSSARFRSGELVGNVDYLGVENQENIKRVNKRVDLLEREIEQENYYCDDETINVDNVGPRKTLSVNFAKVASQTELTDVKNALSNKINSEQFVQQNKENAARFATLDSFKSDTEDFIKRQELTNKDFNTEFTAVNKAIEDANAEIAKKINRTDTYTRTQIDGRLNAKANANDVYSKAETNDLLNAKANANDVYSKAETNDLLNAKANASDVYTQAQVNEKVDAKMNSWVLLLNPNQTTALALNTQQEFTLPDNTNQYQQIKFLVQTPNNGMTTLDFIIDTRMYGKAVVNPGATNDYPSAYFKDKTLKFTIVSSAGVDGRIWVYTDMAIIKIYGIKGGVL